MSLANSTAREAAAGRFRVLSGLVPWAARFAAVVQVNRHAAMRVANRSTESLHLKLHPKMGEVEASLSSRPIILSSITNCGDILLRAVAMWQFACRQCVMQP